MQGEERVCEEGCRNRDELMGEVVMVGVGQAATENRMGQRKVECKLAALLAMYG